MLEVCVSLKKMSVVDYVCVQFQPVTNDFWRGLWLGATDVDNEGYYTWTSDKSNTTFTNWMVGQPDDSGKLENCAAMMQNNGFWNDVPCNATLFNRVWQYTMCEKEVSYYVSITSSPSTSTAVSKPPVVSPTLGK